MLSLDVLRALNKTQGQVVQVFMADIKRRMASAKERVELQQACQAVATAATDILHFTVGTASEEQSLWETSARDYSFSLARTYIGE